MELPSELKFQDSATPTMATLYNYKTQPVSYLQGNTVKFQLPDVGIMNSGTAYIEFCVPPKFQGAGFPLLIGANSAIKSATLSTQSGKILMHEREFNKKATFEKTFRTPEFNRFLAPYYDMSYYTFTINEVGQTDYSTPPVDPKNLLRVAGDPVEVDATNENTPVNDGLTWNRPQVIRPYKDAENTYLQQASIKLADLFPLLYSHQIPVQMMERIYVTIEFQEDSRVGEVFCPVSNNGTAYDPSTDDRGYVAGDSVAQVDLFLISDHIVFSDPDVMARIEAHQEANGGLAFPFTDYAVQLYNLTDADLGNISTTYEGNRALGCNMFKLCDIKTIEQSNVTTGVGIRTIYGDYHSTTPQNSSKQLNFTVNDVNVFPDNTTNKLPVQYDRAASVYSHVPPAIPRACYGCDIKPALEPLIDTMFFAGTPMATGNINSMNVQGTYLKDMMGQEMQNGNSAIRVFLKYVSNVENGNLATGNTQQYFIDYKRELAVSKNGTVMVNEYS